MSPFSPRFRRQCLFNPPKALFLGAPSVLGAYGAFCVEILMTAPVDASGVAMFTALTFIVDNTESVTVVCMATMLDGMFAAGAALHAPVMVIDGVRWYTQYQAQRAHFARLVGAMEYHVNGVPPTPMSDIPL